MLQLVLPEKKVRKTCPIAAALLSYSCSAPMANLGLHEEAVQAELSARLSEFTPSQLDSHQQQLFSNYFLHAASAKGGAGLAGLGILGDEGGVGSSASTVASHSHLDLDELAEMAHAVASGAMVGGRNESGSGGNDGDGQGGAHDGEGGTGRGRGGTGFAYAPMDTSHLGHHFNHFHHAHQQELAHHQQQQQQYDAANLALNDLGSGGATTGGMGSASQSDPLGELEAVNAREQYRVTKRAMHKEVERRRRDVISMGIEQLAELLPVQEKKKGRVVQGAVQYIRELKQIESSNLEKWQVEKSLCEQAIHDLTSTLAQLSEENQALNDHLAMLRDSNKRRRL